jgi:predicted permease
MTRWLAALRLRIRSLVLTDRVDRELREELADHLEREVDAARAAGLSDAEARLAARRSLGAIAQNQEACRDARRISVVDHALRDLRFAVRQLAVNRGFAATTIGVLTLGTASAVAIYGFVDAAMLRPLPYDAPARLVQAFTTGPDAPPTVNRGPVSYLNFRDWRERSRGFSAVAAFDVRTGFNLTTASGPERVRGLRVTSGFFSTLGVVPALGREFRSDEEGPTAPATVMLSHGVWQSRFGGDPAVVGRTVTLQSPWLAGGEPHVVIGVLPPGFHFAMAADADFWATIRGPQPCWELRPCQSLEVVARLADGVTPPAAAADLTRVVAQLQREHPPEDGRVVPQVGRLTPLRDVVLGNVRLPLLMLLGAAGLLWVIAAINGVSLLLARSEVRRREIAVRHALGASTGRLVLQFGAEALVLALVSGTLGVLLAAWSIRALVGLLDADMLARMPYFRDVGVGGRVAACAAVLTAVLVLVLGVVPALRTASARTLAGLKDGTRGGTGAMWRRAGAPLVIAELAIATVLLVNAGLLGKSLYRLLNVDPGFAVDGLAIVPVSPVGETGGNTEGRARLADRIAERVAGLPGVVSASYADIGPVAAGLAPTSTFVVVGRPDDGVRENGPVRRIGPGYFRTLQAPLQRGREFTAADAGGRPIVVINATAAQRYFRGQDPIGQSIAFGGPKSPRREIVGVVADIKDGPPDAPPAAAAYVPFDQTAFTLVVRTARPASAVLPSIVAAVHDVAPGLIVRQEASLAERIGRLPATATSRAAAWLVGGFAAIAFTLGVAGLYGVVAYAVGQRKREIGVRVALGAPRGWVYRLVMRDAGWLVGLGTLIGLAAGVGFATLMRRMLFEIESWDPATLGGAAMALAVAALAASYAPARRAMAVNPVDVLRAE